MQTVTHHGRKTAYRRTDFGDDGPPVLFVHGSGSTHDVWTAQYGRRANEYSAVALDLSGHGESADIDTASGPDTLAAYADDVCAVARETDAELLVGNSLGGAVCLQVALEDGFSPAGLVLAGTGAKLSVHPDLRELLAEDFDRAVEVIHGEDMLFHDPDPEYVEASKQAMRETGRAVTERDFLSCHTFDVRDRLGDIDVPALALVGEYDSLTPVDYHEFLAAEMPECDLVRIDNAAHLAMVERPDAFADVVSQFHDRIRQ